MPRFGFGAGMNSLPRSRSGEGGGVVAPGGWVNFSITAGDIGGGIIGYSDGSLYAAEGSVSPQPNTDFPLIAAFQYPGIGIVWSFNGNCQEDFAVDKSFYLNDEYLLVTSNEYQAGLDRTDIIMTYAGADWVEDGVYPIVVQDGVPAPARQFDWLFGTGDEEISGFILDPRDGVNCREGITEGSDPVFSPEGEGLCGWIADGRGLNDFIATGLDKRARLRDEAIESGYPVASPWYTLDPRGEATFASDFMFTETEVFMVVNAWPQFLENQAWLISAINDGTNDGFAVGTNGTSDETIRFAVGQTRNTPIFANAGIWGISVSGSSAQVYQAFVEPGDATITFVPRDPFVFTGSVIPAGGTGLTLFNDAPAGLQFSTDRLTWAVGGNRAIDNSEFEAICYEMMGIAPPGPE